MVDTSSDRRHACNRLNTDRRRTSTMSPKRTTAPPPIKHSRSSSSGRKVLIAKEKTEKQSARERSALDKRVHRTIWLLGREFSQSLQHKLVTPMRHRYSYLDPDLIRQLLAEMGLRRLFNHLLLQSGGDVDEAMRWMRALQERGYIGT